MTKRALCRRYGLIVLAAGVSMLAMPTAVVAAEAKPFGIAKFTMQTTARTIEIAEPGPVRHFVNEPYTYTQAGGHPWALTTTGEFASEEVSFKTIEEGTKRLVVPTRDPKDGIVDLPPGLLGNPQAVPRCPLTQVLSKNERCPATTQVGVAAVTFYGGEGSLAPIVNLTPEAGQSAEFGVETGQKITFLLTAHVVRTALGYGLTVVSNEIPITEFVNFEFTFWGVPADPSHNPLRALYCTRTKIDTCHGGEVSSGEPLIPFLTMPANCSSGPQTATMRADSWEEPGHVGVNGKYEGYAEKSATLPGATGCNLLQFDPTIEVQPDTLLADEPVGLGVNLQVPQVENPEASATPQLRDSVVTLPDGLSISPGIVDGIQACNENGPEGINFTGPESEEIGLNGELQLAPGHCPDASIVGTAEAITSLLPVPVKGHVYLARPGCGGPGQSSCGEKDALEGNLYQMYLELGGTGALANTGVNLKVRGKVEANPATGQLTAVFDGTPQLPFNELRIHLNGGPRAPLDTPAVCGPALTTTDFTPWSAPGSTPEGLLVSGTRDATPSSFFDVVGCASPPGLNPGFLAGTVTPRAGKFSAFTLNLSRKDREQYVKGIQVHTPAGLLGMLASVPLCGELQANDGTCSEASKIGTTRVASGAGSHPFEIEGNLYLTGPYGDAPFGLSVVVHVVAGPFNLGVVVVRARIAVDPETSTLTITTDETGPHAVPQIIDGVPVRLQRVTVNVDRPNFMFNPSNCGTKLIGATISGSQGATAGVSSPFAVGGCKSLAFKPKFTASASGRTSRARGTSLDVKLSYPSDSMGKQANIAHVKVSLPRQLPSRLTTLQQACPAKTFEANPAACPKASVVGVVRASTPLLPVKLTGPVYFVSHGGEAFPALVIVLQGDGVRVDLIASTFISKAGITSSTLKSVPDVPVSSFELYLPEGKYSALAANGNLCKSQGKLKMPTEFVAQNGAKIKQNTNIGISGCPVRGKAGSKR